MGLSHHISDHMKNCTECQWYKANNQKPEGLVQTPVMPGPQGQRQILTIEEAASCWIELFALKEASAETCATKLIKANMVERKNRDLKVQLAILVGENHADWPDKCQASCLQ